MRAPTSETGFLPRFIVTQPKIRRNPVSSPRTNDNCQLSTDNCQLTFELGLLECCRQHKFWVVELLRNCTIAIPPLPTNSPIQFRSTCKQFQSLKTTKIHPTLTKIPDWWVDENLPKWIDHRDRSRGILPERFVAIAPIALRASQRCCGLLSNWQSAKSSQ